MSADNESDFSRKLAVAMKNVNLEARPVRLQQVIDRQAAARIEALEAEVAALKSNSIPIAGNRPDLHPTATATKANLPAGWLQRDMERAAKRVKELKIVKFDPEPKT